MINRKSRKNSGVRKTVIDLKVGDKGTGTQMLQSLQTNGLQETNFTAEITGGWGRGSDTRSVCSVLGTG